MAGGIRQVDRSLWRQPLTTQGHETDDGFNRAGRSERMPAGGFRGTDAQSIGALTRPTVDGSGFGRVIMRRGRAMRVDVINLRSEERRVGKECRSRWSP